MLVGQYEQCYVLEFRPSLGIDKPSVSIDSAVAVADAAVCFNAEEPVNQLCLK